MIIALLYIFITYFNGGLLTPALLVFFSIADVTVIESLSSLVEK
jgi:hypothetical protein